mmetsp:Transcript_67239/g.186267  ORF Transcript_67239/g.186267 Transcript_67239/m.186267 type:complete len:211 (+) Transcript_67239:1139-1771(+)
MKSGASWTRCSSSRNRWGAVQSTTAATWAAAETGAQPAARAAPAAQVTPATQATPAAQIALGDGGAASSHGAVVAADHKTFRSCCASCRAVAPPSPSRRQLLTLHGWMCRYPSASPCSQAPMACGVWSPAASFASRQRSSGRVSGNLRRKTILWTPACRSGAASGGATLPWRSTLWRSLALCFCSAQSFMSRLTGTPTRSSSAQVISHPV